MFNTFLNQTYVLAVFNSEMSKLILFLKLYLFLRSMSNATGLDRQRFDQKINDNYINVAAKTTTTFTASCLQSWARNPPGQVSRQYEPR